MSVELQIRETSLAALASRTVRQRLRSTCLPIFSGFSIDHLEVVPGGASVVSVQSSVEVHLQVDVSVVTDGALFAAANGVPTGVTNPTVTITLALRLQVTLSEFETKAGESATRSVLSLVPGKPNLGPLTGVLGTDADQVERQLQAVVGSSSIDLTSQLALLGVTKLSTADVVLVGDVVAIRFGVAGTPRSQLFADQEWGLFADAPAVEHLARSKVEPSVLKNLPGATITAHYESVGTVPRVDLEVGQSITISAFPVHVTADLPCDFSLLSGTTAVLRATVDWSLHVVADLVPGFIESIAEGIMEDAFDPTQFGGTPVGDHVFVMDFELPAIPLLGVLFRYDSVLGSPFGMTIGGAVVIPGLYEPPFTLTVSALGGPTRVQLCSMRARTGSGAPSTEPPTVENTTSFGQVDVGGCGAFCGVELRTPVVSFQQYLSIPSVDSEAVRVRVAIPYSVAGGMTQPLTFVIRTSRGVRFVDLGMPPKVQTNASGRILGARDYYIPDCLTVVRLAHGRFGMGWGMHLNVFKPRPVEDPDWAVYLQRAGGIIVKLVRATGLDEGELLRFRSATHAIDVIADANGRAVVPVFLPLAAAVEPALLARADGRTLEGHVAVDSAMFERHLAIPGTLHSGLGLTRSGGALVTTRAAGRTVTHAVTLIGAFSRPATHEETELNPQPMPPAEPWDRIRGVERIVAVPGFASSGTVVAIMADGTKLLVDVTRNGSVRIAGTFVGPIGVVDVAGDWAVAATPMEVTIFRVSTTNPSA
jgi:hypothetical protein